MQIADHGTRAISPRVGLPVMWLRHTDGKIRLNDHPFEASATFLCWNRFFPRPEKVWPPPSWELIGVAASEADTGAFDGFSEDPPRPRAQQWQRQHWMRRRTRPTRMMCGDGVVRTGWYRSMHVKSEASHKLRRLLAIAAR